MLDCENVGVRDQLPELLHERLSLAERARLQAHVDACAECGAELRLLRQTRGAIEAATPRLDADAIARAVAARLAADRAPHGAPALRVVRGGSVAAPASGRRLKWSSTPLRAAAAVVVMALGAGVVATHRPAMTSTSSAAPLSRDSLLVTSPTPAVRAKESVGVNGNDATPRAAAAAAATASALGATFSDLSDDELAAVIQAVDSDAGLPGADSSATPVVASGELL